MAGAYSGTPKQLEIQIVGLCKSFGSHEVLRGVDLEVFQGDLIAVIGGSGCGKTVLLNLILGQLTPDAGRIAVADHSRADAPMWHLGDSGRAADHLHEHWGVVFQRNALFSGSVYDNIALGLREVKHLGATRISEVAQQVLSSVGLPADKAFLTQDHSELSGGMSKRLAIARALSMDPTVLFYDEPTTGLDPLSAAQIQDLILTTHESRPRTTMIITHDKELLQRLEPRVVMLDGGRVVFDGSFAAFSASDSEVTRPYFNSMPALHARGATEGA